VTTLCGGVLFDARRPVRALGGWRGGVRPRAGGRGLGAEQRQLDVAVVLVLLLPVLQGLRARVVWQEIRQGGRLHPPLPPRAQGGGGVQVECSLPIALQAPGLVTQPLNLKCDILVSKAFAFTNGSTCVPLHRGHACQVHIRAVVSTPGGSEEGEVRGGGGLP
jgi:hypothetical protein